VKAKRLWIWSLAALLCVLLGFSFRDDVGPALQALENAIQRSGPFGPVLFTLVFALWATLCLPGPMMLAVAGTLFASRPILAIATVSVGDTIAQAVAFQIARRGARKQVQGWIGSKPWFVWLQQQIAARGARAVLTIRLLPVFPNSLANYAFGLVDLNFGRYLLASWAGTLPNLILYVGGTAGVVHILKNPRWEHDALIAVGVVVLLSGVAFAVRWFFGKNSVS
jgi:uncharacterized membrane protein YdjX (TVP38/TMEM64 family)